MNAFEMVPRRFYLMAVVTALIICTTLGFLTSPIWAQDHKVLPPEFGKYLTIYIESTELLIVNTRETAALEAEYGHNSPQVSELEKEWVRQPQKILDKWGMSTDDYVSKQFRKQSEAYLRDEQAIDLYLEDKPELKARYIWVKSNWDKTNFQHRREALKANPGLLKEYRQVLNRINSGGRKYGEERRKFFEEHPDIKKEHEEVEQKIQEGIEKIQKEIEAVREKRKSGTK